MEIRKGRLDEIEDIMHVFKVARAYMVSHGNATQWEGGYPGEDAIKTDIVNGSNYVIVERGTIIGTFAFIIGEESTYQVIKNGQWHNDRPYGTIHRLASNGTTRGIAKACFEFCFQLMDYIRIDTHKDNRSMQAAIEKYGFQVCGNIYVRNGSERIAYDCLKRK